MCPAISQNVSLKEIQLLTDIDFSVALVLADGRAVLIALVQANLGVACLRGGPRGWNSPIVA
jgi:hypothetical protein